MGNGGGKEAGYEAKKHNRKKRKGSKIAREMSKKELTMTVAELQKLVPYLENSIASLKQQARSTAAREYTTLPGAQGHIHPAQHSQAEVNRGKNRYANIVAYDHSRVTVSPNQYNENSDYINANSMSGEGKYAYVACQGPVPTSFYSHWQMVWESGAEVIVMVTNEVEGGRLKCHRYWPEAGVEVTYGDLTLSGISEKPSPTFVTRKFELTHVPSGQTRNVTQFTYTVWPDHGVPNTTAEILSFRKSVHKAHNGSSTVVVHCSAGVGRSGTYIALDRLIGRADEQKPLNVREVVSEMRDRRNYMVQTQLQYLFVYQALIDALSKRLKRAQRALEGVQADGNIVDEQELDDLEEELEAARENLARQVGYDKEQATEIVDHIEKQLADARHAAGKPTDDVGVSEKISRAQRIESLMYAASAEGWKNNVPILPQDKGYAGASQAGLHDRLHALKEQSSPEKWRNGYTTAAEQWAQVQSSDGDTYDLTQSLSPLESRLQSLAFQQEQSMLRSQGVTAALERDTLEKIAGLTARLTSLQDTLESSDARWRKRGSGMRGEAADAPARTHTAKKLGSLADRLESLKGRGEEWKSRGDGFRGEVENPTFTIKEPTPFVPEPEPEEDPEPEPEPEAEPEPSEPVKSDNGLNPGDDVETKHIDETLTTMKSGLRQAKAEAAAHPMIAQANASPPKGPQGGKLRKKKSHPMIKK